MRNPLNVNLPMLLSMRMLLPVLLPMLRNHNLLSASLHPRARAIHLCPRRFRCSAEGGDTVLLAPTFLCLPTRPGV